MKPNPTSPTSVDPTDAATAPDAVAWEDRRGHKTVERRCVASGQIKDPARMVRFVRSPDGVATPDINGKLPGRGVWVSADAASLEKAVKSGGFAKGFKAKTRVPDGLADMVEALLRRRLLGLITMARKSGKIMLGYDQVKAAAAAGTLAWRIEARDGSEDGRGKIRTLSKAVARELELPLPSALGCFTARELAEALSRETVVHIGLPRGPMAKSFARDARRLEGFTPLVPTDWPDFAHEQKYRLE